MTSVGRSGAGVAIRLSATDATLLRTLAEQVMTLLAEPGTAEPTDPLEQLVGMTGTSDSPPPDDPALHRLLPDAYADDAAAAREFRGLMDGELRRTKAAALELVLSRLGDREIGLAAEEAEGWLQGLNDIRLVLGVRLGVQEDMDEFVAGLERDDPRWPLLYAYDRVTRLQDAIIDAVDEEGD